MASVEDQEVPSSNINAVRDVDVGTDGALSIGIDVESMEEGIRSAAQGSDPGPAALKTRWRNTVAAICLNAPTMFYWGSSVVLPYMNAMSENSWVAPGITQPALMNVIANMIIQPYIGNSISQLSPHRLWLAAVTFVVNPLLIALSAQLELVWLQYIGALIGSMGFLVGLQCATIVMQWWALDGRVAMGTALLGAGVTVLTLALACVSAVLFSAIGFVRGMYIITAIISAGYLYPLWLVLRGELGGPNTTTSAAKPAIVKPLIEPSSNVYASCAFWQMFFHFACFPFVGFAMKALTTTIFQTAYEMAYLESSFMFILSLTLFLVVRAALPFLTDSIPVASLSAWLMGFSSAFYALYPIIVAYGSAWAFLLAKTLAGAAFAGVHTVSTLLLLRVWGPANLPKIFSALGFARGIGFGLGPLLGHYCQVYGMLQGGNARYTFNLFFNMCAVVAALDTVNLVWFCCKTCVDNLADSSNKAKTNES